MLSHSLEVAWLAGLMAGELGINVQLARRAGLLHDIGKALAHEIEGSHVQIGVDICKKYRENPQVIHAIEAHHGDVEPKTTLAFIIMAADAISAARPGARRENMESYIKRLETLEALCNGFEASKAPTLSRLAARSASWSSRTRSATIRSSCWRAMSPKRSRTSWITPARSRSASSAKAALPSTQNNFRSLPLAGRLLFYYSAPSGRGPFSY